MHIMMIDVVRGQQVSRTPLTHEQSVEHLGEQLTNDLECYNVNAVVLLDERGAETHRYEVV